MLLISKHTFPEMGGLIFRLAKNIEQDNSYSPEEKNEGRKLYADFKKIALDIFHISPIDSLNDAFDSSIHQAFGKIASYVVGINRIGYQVSVTHPAEKMRGEVLEKAHVALGEKNGEPISAIPLPEKIATSTFPSEPSKENLKESDLTTSENKEALENPERQKALAVLSEFFQERSQQTTTHRALDTLIKKMRGICESAIPYVKAIYPDFKDIKVQDNSSWGSDGYNSIVVLGKNASNVEKGLLTHLWQEGITNLRDLQKEEAYKNDKNLQTLIVEYERTRNALEETKNKIFQAKEAVVRSFGDFDEFKEIKDGNIYLCDAPDSLYNNTDYIRVDHKDQTVKDDYLYFKDDEWLNYFFLGKNNRLNSLMERLNISKDDIAQMQEIQWTDKDKKALQLVLQFHEQAKKTTIEPYILNMQKNPALALSPADSDNIKHILTKSNIHKLYDTVKLLPSQFREHAIIQIMTGNLTLNTL